MGESLDRDAVDRVLRRASELAGSDDEPSDGIEPAALIAAAADVGIPERSVRRSLAIERAGPKSAARRLDSLVGPAFVHGERIVAARPDRVLDVLDRWLVNAHHLRRERMRPDVMVWTRRSDVVGSAKRAARGLTGEGRLGDAGVVRAALVPVDGDETLVAITIDRMAHRRTAVAAGGTLGAAGMTAGAVGLAMAAPFALAAVPAAGASWFVARSSRGQAHRFGRELERLLDAVEELRPPTGMLGGIGRRLRPGRRNRDR